MKKNEDKKMNNKKRLISGLMFTGIVGSILSVSTISIIYSTNQTKKIKYINDDKKDITLKEEQLQNQNKKITFVLKKEIQAEELFDFNNAIRIEKQQHDFGIRSLPTFSFYKTGYNLNSFFNNVNNSIEAKLEENTADEEIFNLDLIQKLDEFNNQTKHPISFSFFVRQLTNIKLPFTYFFKNKNNEFYYYESPKDLIGLEIKEIFFQVHKYLNDLDQNVEIENNNFKVKSNVTTKEDKIEKVNIEIELGFELKKDTTQQ
ncbi:hypothetical protein [Metamycoplasma gateae]|uniref:Protein BptA n=1 Tax=Metamycoplasma gateae TaxID=35769 RepID=A0ABZ2AGK8_9BACT|nr:hypothetical protein V2E26_02435 [Metamycoplasma gateae]